MSDSSIHVLAVSGSVSEQSATRVAIDHLAQLVQDSGGSVDILDLHGEPLEIFSPETTYVSQGYPALKERVARADAVVLGTPDYHGTMSGATKNFLDHFWTEFAGKLFGSIVASYEKGLTVTDQIRTVARQCYAWSMPYGVSLQEKADVRDGEIVSDAFANEWKCLRATCGSTAACCRSNGPRTWPGGSRASWRDIARNDPEAWPS